MNTVSCTRRGTAVKATNLHSLQGWFEHTHKRAMHLVQVCGVSETIATWSAGLSVHSELT